VVKKKKKKKGHRFLKIDFLFIINSAFSGLFRSVLFWYNYSQWPSEYFGASPLERQRTDRFLRAPENRLLLGIR